MIVLDASAALEVVLQTRGSAAITDRVLAVDEELHAPHLLDVEVAQVLRRLGAAGELADLRGQQALADLHGLCVRRHAHELLLPRAWELRHNVTIYDGVYLALAELLRCPLVTRDRRLERAATGLAEVEVF